MVRKAKMHMLDVNKQYISVYPETSANQVIVDKATGQTLASKLNSGSIGALQHKISKRNYVVSATTNGQTVFPFNAPGLNISDAIITVHLNGEFLHRNEEYTVTMSGNTPQIVLTTGILNNDKIHVAVEQVVVEPSPSLTNIIGDVTTLAIQTKTISGAVNEVKQRSEETKRNVVQSLLSKDSSLPITENSSWDQISSSIGNINTGIDINGVIEQYKVQAGETISAGDFVEFVTTNGTMSAGSPIEFNIANTDYISAVKLNENKVLVSYNNNSHYGSAVILTINGTTITKGSPIVFNSAGTYYISAVALNENKVLVSYRDDGNSYYGTAVVLTINDTSITKGSPIVFESATTGYISAVALNENKVLVSYRDDGNSDYYTAIVLTINDTSITKGSSITLGRGGAVYTSVVKLNENKVLVSYRDYGNSGYGTAIVLTINDTSITAGSPIVFESASTYDISAVTLNENKVLVSYRDNGNSSYGTAIVLTINDTSITKGSPIVFESANTTDISAVSLNENKVLVSYRDIGNSHYGTAIILTISDTSITTGSPIVFEYAQSICMSAVTLNENKVVVSYTDYGNAYYGTATIISTGINTSIKKATIRQNIKGVAQSAGSAGQTISIKTL